MELAVDRFAILCTCIRVRQYPPGARRGQLRTSDVRPPARSAPAGRQLGEAGVPMARARPIAAWAAGPIDFVRQASATVLFTELHMQNRESQYGSQQQT